MAHRTSPYPLTELLGLLTCPVCRAELRVVSEKIFCTACDRRYPIIDGIPVLIAERGEGVAELG